MSNTPETDALREAIDNGTATEAEMTSLAGKLERERNSLQDQRDFCMGEIERLRKERDEAREDAKRATYDAAQETIKVSTVKSHWIQACRERDEAREALRDMLSGWKYIRSVHGDIYGVGWDRAQSKAETALEGTK